VPGALLKRGAFVTISVGGALRGCIGHIAADRALGVVVREMTVAAAQDDPRFPPVERDELPELAVEISVLSEATPVVPPVDPAGITVGRDGLMVRRGQNVGLLLPQVARDHHWGADALLAAACRKAGLPPDAWREPGTELFTFQAEVFGETSDEGRGKRDE
jgi:AmmeMemoRadiSam system protein A